MSFEATLSSHPKPFFFPRPPKIETVSHSVSARYIKDLGTFLWQVQGYSVNSFQILGSSLLTCPNCIIGWSSLSRVVCEKKGKDLDGFISETKLPYYYYNEQLLSNLLIIYWKSAENHTQARISPIWRT